MRYFSCVFFIQWRICYQVRIFGIRHSHSTIGTYVIFKSIFHIYYFIFFYLDLIYFHFFHLLLFFFFFCISIFSYQISLHFMLCFITGPLLHTSYQAFIYHLFSMYYFFISYCFFSFLLLLFPHYFCTESSVSHFYYLQFLITTLYHTILLRLPYTTFFSSFFS